MEATVGKLPSTLELEPEVVALAEQRRHTVGLQVVHTRGRSRLHLPRLVHRALHGGQFHFWSNLKVPFYVHFWHILVIWDILSHI